MSFLSSEGHWWTFWDHKPVWNCMKIHNKWNCMIIKESWHPRDVLSNKITKSWAITFLKGAEVQGDGCGPPPSNVPNQPAFFSHPPSHTHSHWPHLKREESESFYSKRILKGILTAPCTTAATPSAEIHPIRGGLSGVLLDALEQARQVRSALDLSTRKL